MDGASEAIPGVHTPLPPPIQPYQLAYKARHPAWNPSSRKSIVAPSYHRTDESTAIMGLEWILPWSDNEYPGFRNGVMELFGWRMKWAGIRGWKRRNNWPSWAIERVLLSVTARVERGQQIITGLTAELEQARQREANRQPSGFCRVSEETGKDARGHWRR